MDLDLTRPIKEIYEESMRISEACGYMPDFIDMDQTKKKGTLRICSQDYDMVLIEFENQKVLKTWISHDDGVNFEELDNQGLRIVSQKTLKSYIKSITFGNEKSLPMSQGLLLKEILKKYKIPFKAYGWHYDLIGIETKKQFLIWRDTGIGAEFLGIVNKDGSLPK